MATVGTPSANTKMMHDNRENLLGALRRFATFLLLQLALSSSLNLCGPSAWP